MKILFSGSSSFTGFWFIRELVTSGFEVVATFSGREDNYKDIRRERVKLLKNLCECVFDAPFGSDRFCSIIEQTKVIDCYCHHYSQVTNYRSESFNFISALEQNTKNLASVLDLLKKKKCQKILLTGSLFEPGEGIGSENLPAFSPYGLSKAMTCEVFKYYCKRWRIGLGKFVIPNPFGPYEELRFTSYLIKTWLNKGEATVKTPLYIRDNIPISLLSKTYVDFLTRLNPQSEFSKFNPSGYIESQGAFANRVAVAMRSRLDCPCVLLLLPQTDFSEPLIRVNYEPAWHVIAQWNEDVAWDEYAQWALNYYGSMSTA